MLKCSSVSLADKTFFALALSSIYQADLSRCVVNMETIVAVVAVDEAVAVDMDVEEDVVDATPTNPTLKILTESSRSSLP